MSKKNKKQNVTGEVVNNNTMEGTDMKEKKSVIETIKEVGNKVPKPVKVIAGGVAAAAAIAGTALVVVSKIRNGEDADFDEVEDFEDVEVDAAEAEAPVEE